MMLCTMEPRFCETDALGHINNTVVPMWFETARTPIFEVFNPGQDLKKWNMILRKMDVDFIAQIYYGHPVEIRTRIGHIGSSSFTFEHEAWQRDELVAKGSAVMIYFDYVKQCKQEITPALRAELEKQR
ncbi:acyl-CoA thioesterase [Zhongshania sp. BJYM1]|uniref:acyl-CoA thioesterase n=1 Tax=Zhongshania aquatica TaxID=2965069 RepID=UPI0022B2E9B1|nr:thioesterase family protein [Marortus sp. BJYM1]